jgi:hypothetical protein
MSKESPESSPRRSFLTRFNAGLVSVAAMAGLARAQQKPAVTTRWEPARHEKDDWLDQIPGKHRIVFDTTNPDKLVDAMAFAGNFFRTNRTEYGLESSDLAVLLIVRHRATALAYNDAIWAKYGATLATFTKLEDPKTKEAPKLNLYNATGYGDAIPTRGVTLESLAKLGAQFGVCSVATRALAGMIAGAVKGDANTVFNELTSNLISNGRMVPAGIIAVNRAQERGYSLVA